MRIAHVSATFPPYYAGTGTVCYHNARELASLGHDVHVFTADWPGVRDDPKGVTTHRMRPVVRAGNAPVLPRLAGLTEFDLVHLHYPFIFGAELIAVNQLLHGVPYVVTYHNDLIAPGLRGAFFALYERGLTGRVLRRASRVCAVSLSHAEASATLAKALRFGRDSIVEMPNGVDTEVFHPGVEGSSMRRDLGIPDDRVVLGFVARLDAAHHFKRLDLLLRALHASGLDSTHVLVVGGGDRRMAYESLAKDLGLSQRVHFVGEVPHSSLPPYLAACDGLVLPSDSVESFGLVLIEAMACGRPVIASALPGVATVVDHGKDGLLVTPGDVRSLSDAIRAMSRMPASERRRMGHVGRVKVVRRYSWQVIGRELERLYLEVEEERVGRYSVVAR